MDKNYDQVRQDVLDLFLSSRTKVGPCPASGLCGDRAGGHRSVLLLCPQAFVPVAQETRGPVAEDAACSAPCPFPMGFPRLCPPSINAFPLLGFLCLKNPAAFPRRGLGGCCATTATFLLCNPSRPSKVVANLFFGHAQVLARQRSLVRRSSTRTRRYKAPTVAARFQQSLLDLVEKMERSGRAGRALVAGLALSPVPCGSCRPSNAGATPSSCAASNPTTRK